MLDLKTIEINEENIKVGDVIGTKLYKVCALRALEEKPHFMDYDYDPLLLLKYVGDGLFVEFFSQAPLRYSFDKHANLVDFSDDVDWKDRRKNIDLLAVTPLVFNVAYEVDNNFLYKFGKQYYENNNSITKYNIHLDLYDFFEGAKFYNEQVIEKLVEDDFYKAYGEEAYLYLKKEIEYDPHVS